MATEKKEKLDGAQYLCPVCVPVLANKCIAQIKSADMVQKIECWIYSSIANIAPE